MKSRSELLTQVKEELKHIPRGSRGSTQNIFRLYYYSQRMHDVAKTSKTKNETFKEVINSVKKEHPNFVPKYDPNYFSL
jgi:hypothetical protein